MTTSAGNQSKMVILFVDHDKESLSKILEGISDEVAPSTMKPVGEKHDISGILVDPEPDDSLAQRAIAEIDKQRSRPHLILVDLSFDNKHTDNSIQKGRRLAEAIRTQLMDVAVGVYSRHELSPKDKGFISADRFALRLDECNKMYDSTQAMTGDDWNKVFERVRDKWQEENARLPLVFTTQSAKNISWSENHPLSRSFGFEKAAPQLVARALSHLDLSKNQIKLTQMVGGFSGSFLVKAEIVEGASFVVKIDEDPNRIANELAGYRKIRAKLDHKFYLMPDHAENPVTLTSDWWGAFAVPHESDAKPLLEELPSMPGQLASLYEDLWRKCLFNLYGQVTSKKVPLKDIVPKGFGAKATDAWNSLSRYRDRFSPPGSKRLQDIQNLLSTVLKNDQEGYHSRKITVPWVDQVHGDLNCRNILYNKSQDFFKILDFPHVGPNCLAFDFVRAEAELVLMILDWTTGRDCDFERIKGWESITSLFSVDLIPTVRTFDDSEADRAFESIMTIRQLYQVKAGSYGDATPSYLTYLFARVLRYLSYPDLTVQKRHFVFLWAAQLVQIFSQPDSKSSELESRTRRQ